MTGQSLPLRPYQGKVIADVLDAYRRGEDRQLVVLPTGAGKTVIAAHLRDRLGPEWRTVVLVHRDELVGQTVEKVLSVDPTVSVGVVKAEADDAHGDVTIVSAQTIAREVRLERLCAALEGSRVLFVSDEAHHDPSPSRTRCIERLNPALLVGLSATPDRKGMARIYTSATSRVGMLDLITEGYLAPIKGRRIVAGYSLDGVSKTSRGDFAEDDLAALLDTPEMAEFIVDTYERHAITEGRTRTVVFCPPSVHAVYAQAEAFRRRGHAAEAITHETPKGERRSSLARFHDGSLPILVNSGVLTEGWDEPAADCGILARPTLSDILYRQMVGRFARPSRATGKVYGLILDICGASARYSLQSIGGLLEDEIAATEAATGWTIPRPPAGADVDTGQIAMLARRLTERRAEEFSLMGRSLLNWSRIEAAGAWSGGYVAPAGNNAWLALRPEGDAYTPMLVEGGVFQWNKYGPGGRRTPPTLTPLFLRPLDVETAISVAEQNAADLLKQHGALMRKDAGWRVWRMPPSTEQIKLAQRLGLRAAPNETKGALSARIDLALFVREIRRA